MFRRKLAIVLLALVMALSPILAIATNDNWQVDRSEDDISITELGHVFSTTPYIILEDPGYSTTSYVLFRDLAISRYAKINNATLSVYTLQNQSIARGSSSTIVGINQVDPILNGTLYPETSSFVIWNTSDVMGEYIWHNVTVTNIVRELVNRYTWASGQNLGFKILSVANTTRQFVAFDYGNPTWACKLYITYDVAPVPGEPDYPDYLNTTYGGQGNSTITWTGAYRNYDIWTVNITGPGPRDLVLSKGDFKLYYYRMGSGTAPVEIIANTRVASPTAYSGIRRIIRTPGVLYAVVDADNGSGSDQIWLCNSTDNGATWNTGERVSQWAGMASNSQREPCIAQDSSGRIHVVWTARNPTQFLAHATRFLNRTWTYENITLEPNTEDSNIFIDSADNVHISFSAKNATNWNFKQVYYANSTASGVSPILRISTTDVGNHLGSSIVAYLNSTPVGRPYIGIAWTRWDGGGTRYCRFRERDAFGWLAQETLGGGTINQEIALNLRYSRDAPFPNPPYLYQVVWQRWDGASFDIHVGQRHVKETPPSFTSTVISNPDQRYQEPSIMVDDAGDYFLAYVGNTDDDLYRYYYFDTNNSASGPTKDLTNTVNNPSLALSNSALVASYWFAVDPNGTVINPTNPCDGPDCIEEIIDDLLGEDPQDPDPTGWDDIPYFSRFEMRRYFLIIGWGAFWGPLWFFCYRRPSGYYIGAGFIVMLMGLGLLIQIPYI